MLQRAQTTAERSKLSADSLHAMYLPRKRGGADVGFENIKLQDKSPETLAGGGATASRLTGSKQQVCVIAVVTLALSDVRRAWS
eukprot:104073-Rhodomonas_salina.2